MPKTAIETELRKATKIRAKKGETRQKFLTRLAKAVQLVEDDDGNYISGL